MPFIARYRKEVTGELDEVQLRDIESRVQYLRNLSRRKEEIIRLIDEQGKLTGDLKEKILKSAKLREVEDIYRPYRQKRRTRAGIAREKGLEPLARCFLDGMEQKNPEEEAAKYIDEEKEVNSVSDALKGASDIIAEIVADDPGVRDWVRNFTYKKGQLSSVQSRKSEASSVYEMYYGYEENISSIVPHRILAINRGEREGYLRVHIRTEEEKILNYLKYQWVKEDYAASALVAEAVKDGYSRLLAPAIERDIRAELTERGETRAVKVFSQNLRQLLLQSPVKGMVVLGVDPAYRTGCKWAVVDRTGKLLETGVIYPTPPHEDVSGAVEVFKDLIGRYDIDVIAIGNGTASRETEQFTADFIKSGVKNDLKYVIVSEDGASVYSASEKAAREFPQLDVSERSAVSIARRLQDPLAELVKIEPRALGVGQYQHDIARKRLEEQLTKVVESAVNYAGVDLNTASSELLRYVSGINQPVAEKIVFYRDKNGIFNNREELKKVPRLGPKTFEQSAGFLRLSGDNPLDNTPIHPESYNLTSNLLSMVGASTGDIGTSTLKQKLDDIDLEEVSSRTGGGVPTLRDITESLNRPGRDPREDLPAPVFRTDVLELKDLREGMQLKGTVRNVVDFGAFIDIGVKVDGLLHISQMSEHYIKHPMDVVAVGDVVEVKVIAVDIDRQRINLSLRV